MNTLLKETWTRPYKFETFTQFAERSYTGHFVNVDKNGFRHIKDQGSWPPSPDKYNIFVFGGSTTFGYGLPDEQTVVSHLQQIFKEKVSPEIFVYNFGRGDYFSTHERILFEKLLGLDFVPNAAIFIDGLNDFFYFDDNVAHSYKFQKLFEGPKLQEILDTVLDLPIARASRSLANNWKQEDVILNRNEEDVELIVNKVIHRYLQNKKIIEAISQAYFVTSIFVWQPVPTYKYDLNSHLFAKWGLFNIHPFPKYGYPRMAKVLNETHLGTNFLWAADIQSGIKEPLYVDQAHYSNKLSKMLATYIVDSVIERNLL